MSNQSNKKSRSIETTTPDEPWVYQIRLEGQLGPQWNDWFDGLTVTLEEDNDTLLSGPVTDQAALYGLLRKVRDLGMPLISVMRIAPEHEKNVGHSKWRTK